MAQESFIEIIGYSNIKMILRTTKNIENIHIKLKVEDTERAKLYES